MIPISVILQLSINDYDEAFDYCTSRCVIHGQDIAFGLHIREELTHLLNLHREMHLLDR
jgi:hypothetical protein